MESGASKILERGVDALASLPGVGRKTALRFALNLIGRSEDGVTRFTEAISKLKSDIHTCKICHNICDGEICEICADMKRDKSTICVVENIMDVIAVENTGQYRGLYHVLGGVISPMEGVAPGDLNINTLVERVERGDIREVIFALSATIEGDSTAFYINKKLSEFNSLVVTTIAKGISVGNELGYTDELTLGKSILNRTAL